MQLDEKANSRSVKKKKTKNENLAVSLEKLMYKCKNVKRYMFMQIPIQNIR